MRERERERRREKLPAITMECTRNYCADDDTLSAIKVYEQQSTFSLIEKQEKSSPADVIVIENENLITMTKDESFEDLSKCEKNRLVLSVDEDSEFKKRIDLEEDDELTTSSSIQEDGDNNQRAFKEFLDEEQSTMIDTTNNNWIEEEKSTNDNKETDQDETAPNFDNDIPASNDNNAKDKDKVTDQNLNQSSATIELRFLVRRREAGALIGKRGFNIKRLRDTFKTSLFSIPDTGNGPERIVCITTDAEALDLILQDFTQLLMEKSPENDEQIELKLLIHSSHAGSIIGIGGQSIKRLRNDSKAAIKIFEMCCPLSNERVCAIKAKPPVVARTIRIIQSILNENPIKGTIKPYDALHFDLNLIDKYGGYLPDEPISSSSSAAAAASGLEQSIQMIIAAGNQQAVAGQSTYGRQVHSTKHYSVWRPNANFRDSCMIDNNHMRSDKIKNHPEQQVTMNNSTDNQSEDTQSSPTTTSSNHHQVNNNNDKLNQGGGGLRSANRFHPYSYAPLNNRFSQPVSNYYRGGGGGGPIRHNNYNYQFAQHNQQHLYPQMISQRMNYFNQRNHHNQAFLQPGGVRILPPPLNHHLQQQHNLEAMKCPHDIDSSEAGRSCLCLFLPMPISDFTPPPHHHHHHLMQNPYAYRAYQQQQHYYQFHNQQKQQQQQTSNQMPPKSNYNPKSSIVTATTSAAQSPPTTTLTTSPPESFEKK